MVGKAYEKHIRYLSALLCTAIIVSPILNFVPRLDIKDYYVETEIDVDSMAAEKLVLIQQTQDMEKTVADHIFSQTGIKADSVSIQIESKDGEPVAEKVIVKISSPTDVKAVKDCLEDVFGSTVPTEVVSDG